MSSNAQRELYLDTVESDATDLRRLAAERLAAHRVRRASLDPHPAPQTPSRQAQAGMSAAARRAREAVAARYSQTPSYKEFLAAEAEQAVQRAQAEVEVAERTAQAVAEVQSQLLRELERWPPEPTAAPVTPPVPLELEVRHIEALPPTSAQGWPAEAVETVAPRHSDEEQQLNEEIAFRLEPEFDVHLLEPLPIQANIIQFPRQLVAAKKARPRLAEGPLRSADEEMSPRVESAPHAELAPQLELASQPEFQMRIFEVETESSEAVVETPAIASMTTAVESASAAQPEWQRLVLDAVEEEDEAPSWSSAATPAVAAEMGAAMRLLAERPPVQPARRELWAMAVAVDALIIGAGFVALAAVTAAVAGAALPHAAKTLLVEGAVALLGLSELYQALFFVLGTTTPGMAYANLEFRAVDGGEPSRRAMRRRLWANLLAIAPAGAGVLWSLFDPEGLGWNDRLSGVYVREF